MARPKRFLATLAFVVAIAFGVMMAHLQRAGSTDIRLPGFGPLPFQDAPEPSRPGAYEPPERSASEIATPRQSLSSAPLAAGEETWVLTGRISPWRDLPQDEQAEVLSFSQPASYAEVVINGSARPAARADVGDDGRFAILIPGSLDRVHLWVLGRYAFTTVGLPVDREGSHDALELPVRIGAHLVGWIDLAGERELAVQVVLAFDPAVQPAQSLAAEDLGRRIVIDGAGSFELRALWPGLDCTVAARAHGFAPCFLPLRTAPGLRLETELSLDVGSTLAGRVVDERGDPISAAVVRARLERPSLRGFGASDLASTVTDAAGGFWLHELPTEALRLSAAASGFLDGSLAATVASEGSWEEGLLIQLSRGRSLAGRALLADGRPAAGAEIQVELDPAASLGSRGASSPAGRRARAASGADGRFEVQGLGDGPFRVLALLERREGERTRTLRASRGAVEPGGDALELVLEAPLAISGRVVGPGGEGVEQFHLRAAHQELGRTLWGRAEVVEASFEDDQGRFWLEGLWPGPWKLEVQAAGHLQASAVRISLASGQDARDLVLAVERPWSIAGRVIDGTGQARPGASVTRHFGLLEQAADPRAASEAPRAVADRAGRFVLEGLPRSPLALVATHPDHAPSEPVRVDPENPGSVELALRQGATLLCEVYDELGRPVEAQLYLQNLPAHLTLATRADRDGRARIEHLAPGPWQVTARHSALGSGAGSQSLGGLRTLAAELAPGAEERLVFGEPPREPVHVRGRLSATGIPVRDALLGWRPRVGVARGPSLCTSDASGEFEVVLDGAGSYLVHVQCSLDSRRLHVEMGVEVPIEGRTLELALPGGSLRGRVLRPDQQPIQGVLVSARSAGTPSYACEARSDANGRYELTMVPPGLYTISAGGPDLVAAGMEPGAAWGTRLLGGIRLEDGQVLEGLDLQLSPPCILEGIVRDLEGRPVPSAAIGLRDRDGRQLTQLSTQLTDAEGRFTAHVPAGELLLLEARARHAATAEPLAVTPSEGAGSPVELHLGPATLLRVVVELSGQRAVLARVSVRDERGHEHVGWVTLDPERVAEGSTGRGLLVGPLPPGRYQVEACAGPLGTASRSVRLRGVPESEIRLVPRP